jgi:hypothetical protein
MGHASLQTTEGYLGTPSLDELAEAVSGLSFLPPDFTRLSQLVETVGIEPTSADARETASTSVVGALCLASR